MDIIDRIRIIIGEEGIVAADVETNTAKGHIDVIGGEKKKKRKKYTFHRDTNGRKRGKPRK